MDHEEDVNLSEVIHEALSNALKDMAGGAIVTRWVLSVERYTAEGKSMAYVASPDMEAWEVIGMAEMASEFARVQASAAILDEMYSGDDDDD